MDRGTSVKDIQNETRALMKLSLAGMENIVTILKLGKLENVGCFFFDMELCDADLETYINGKVSPALGEQINSAANIDPKETLSHLRIIWKIMSDTCKGVSFIHENQEVHRDLKPRNSMSEP